MQIEKPRINDVPQIHRLINSVDNIRIDKNNRLVFDRDKFNQIVIDYPDTAFENRETPKYHRFRTATAESRVVILQRK